MQTILRRFSKISDGEIEKMPYAKEADRARNSGCNDWENLATYTSVQNRAKSFAFCKNIEAL